MSALALTLTLAGCGAPGDRAQIQRTFDIVARGLIDGDGRAVCAHMTQGVISALASNGIQEGLGASCPVVVHAQAPDYGPTARTTTRHARLLSITIDGTHAFARDSAGGPPDRFAKVDGHWYLSGGGGLN